MGTLAPPRVSNCPDGPQGPQTTHTPVLEIPVRAPDGSGYLSSGHEPAGSPGPAPGGRLSERWNTMTSLVKRFGVYGLIFFTVKGLLWIVVPALVVYLGKGG